MNPEAQQDTHELLSRICDLLDLALFNEGHRKLFKHLTYIHVLQSTICNQCGESTEKKTQDLGAFLEMQEITDIMVVLALKFKSENEVRSNCVGTCTPSQQAHRVLQLVQRQPDHFLMHLKKEVQDRDHLGLERSKVRIYHTTKIVKYQYSKYQQNRVPLRKFLNKGENSERQLTMVICKTVRFFHFNKVKVMLIGR